MNRDEALELIPLYALEALDPASHHEVETWLAKDAELRAELATYQAVADALLLALPLHPAPDLGPRLHLATQTRPRLSGRGAVNQRWRWVAAVLALVILAGGIWAIVRNFSEDKEKPGSTTAELIDRILHDPDSQDFTVEPQPAFASIEGRLLVDVEAEYGVLQLTGVAPLPPEQDYQVWFVRDGEDRFSGGVFSPTADNRVLALVNLPNEFATYQVLGVTIEPRGGSPGPTGDAVLRAMLQTTPPEN
jgi:anti-sigma-K factor RskA